MAMFGPAGQNAMQMGTTLPTSLGGLPGWKPKPSAAEVAFRRATLAGNVAALRWFGLNQQQAEKAIAGAGGGRTMARSEVISPGQTQVIRPSQQQQQRAQAPQAGASSSLITSTPSPAEVALATTSLLGG
jgi:hypothetical protein